MLIRMRRTRRCSFGVFRAGAVVNVPEALAARFLHDGSAEPAPIPNPQFGSRTSLSRDADGDLHLAA